MAEISPTCTVVHLEWQVCFFTEVIHLNEEALDGATVGELRDVHGLDDDDADEFLIRMCEFEFGIMHVSWIMNDELNE